MIIKNALVFTLDKGFIKKDVAISNGRFTDSVPENTTDEIVIDAAGDYLIPGLVDIHFHGCAGFDFSDGTPEALLAIGEYEAKCGVTSICPASMTLPEAALEQICANAWLYHEQSQRLPVSRLCGIHLEGPFISPEKKGAQNPAFIQMPNIDIFEHLWDISHGLIRLITIAPETTGAREFIQTLGKKVHISLGHTCCDYATALEAFSLGADHMTHMFNAMPGFTHRSPGIIGAAFDSSHVMPELICDGIHIDPSAVRIAFQIFGGERIILISDSMMAAGMKDGAYSLVGLPVSVRGNLATLADGTIAGSATNLMDCMRTAVSMGIPLETAVRCASYNPARSIGVDALCGSIDSGKYGDCVLLSKDDLSTREVILKGERLLPA